MSEAITDAAPSQDARPPRNPVVTRSRGTKLIIVCILAVLMAVPALLVWGLLLERTNRADAVTHEIGGLMGGQQTFLGPVVRVPYDVPRREVVDGQGHKSTVDGGSGALIVFPVTGKVDAKTKSEVRSRSLFRVPVYESRLVFSGHFDFTGVESEAPTGAVLHWDKAELLTGASDSRGARSDIFAHMASPAGATSTTLAPAKIGHQTVLAGDGNGNGTTYSRQDNRGMDMFAAPAGLTAPAALDAQVSMTFTGAQSISFLAFAKSTEATVAGDWNAPSFGGGFLPATRALPRDKTTAPEKGVVPLKSGFSATWSIPFIARGLPAVIEDDNLSSVGKSVCRCRSSNPPIPTRAWAGR